MGMTGLEEGAGGTVRRQQYDEVHRGCQRFVQEQ